jgi:autotransporter-associated beta strand protein
MTIQNRRSITLSVVMLLAGQIAASAQTLYWDVNGTQPGTSIGEFADGNWDDTTPNWSTDPSGNISTLPWDNSSHAVFSAGDDGLDAFININGPRTVGALTIQEGRVGFFGSQIVIGSNPARVEQGAILQIPNQVIMSTAIGHVLTLNGGTLRNTNPGFAASIYPGMNTQIHLTSNGGTVDIPSGPAGMYGLQLYGGTIGMTPGTTTATLTKTGPGEFRLMSGASFTALNVEQGLYRIHAPSGAESGFGAPTGTVTVAGGAVENTTNGAAIGTNMALIGANASPATRSFVLSGLGDTPDSMFMLNASWAINGSISGPGGLMLNGWARNDGGGAITNVIGSQNTTLTLVGANTYGGATAINFGTLAVNGGSAIPDTSAVMISTRSAWGGNAGSATTTLNTAVFRVDASETIGSLAGGNATRGVVNLNGAGVTLTTGGDDTNTTYGGSISGAGSLVKDGAGTFAMNGSKTYTGDTTVLAGTLSTNSDSFADLADVSLVTGATLNLNFAGIDIIDSLFINGGANAVGTWGAPGSGATFTTPLISGTGWLQVTIAPEPSTFAFSAIALGILIAQRKARQIRRK